MSRSGPLEISLGLRDILVNLSSQIFQRLKLFLVAKAIKKPDTNHVAIKIARPIHYESLNRRFRVRLKRRSGANICNTSAPMAINQCTRDVHAMGRYDAVLRVQVGRREAQLVTALIAPNHHTFYAIGASQHAASKID